LAQRYAGQVRGRGEESAGPSRTSSRHSSEALPWLAGFIGSLIVLAPALKPGSLLNFDMVLPPRIPVPSGVWGLGPDVPRRMPLGVLLAWASNLVGGRFAGVVLFLACLTVAFAGAAWLVRGAAMPFRLLAGLLFAFNPFTLTRLVAGHWTVLAAMAVLPWALPSLLRPSEDLRRTFLWCVAFGATGFVGGAFGACLLGVGLIADRGRQIVPVIGRWIVGQLPWLVPGVIVVAAGPHLAGSAAFPTRGEGPLGPLGSLLAGHGFWQPSVQVGGQASLGIVVLGIAFLALGIYGMRLLPAEWGTRAAAVAALGLLIAVASATPGLRAVYGPLSATPLLEAFRESQKGLGLYLAWLAPAAALGAVRLAGHVSPRQALYTCLAIACALALDGTGLSSLYHQLEPVQFPASLRLARKLIEANPGTTLAFPWHQYLQVSWADNRLLLNPLSDYLGGDVLSSSNPELGQPHLERVDPREATVERWVNNLSPDQVDAGVKALGVRWVVLLHEVDWQAYSELDSDPALQPVISAPELTLYRVRTWVAGVTASGAPVHDHPIVEPLRSTSSSGPAVLSLPFALGWLRGWHLAHETPSGLIGLPAGGGLVWYWPALIVVLADLLWIFLICRSWYVLARGAAKIPGPGQTVDREPRPVLYSGRETD
jgi:hypothetical protein